MPTPDDLKAALRSIEGAKTVDPELVVSTARRRRNAKLAGVTGSAILALGALAVFTLPSLSGLTGTSGADTAQLSAGKGQPPIGQSESESDTNTTGGNSDLATGAFNCAASAKLPEAASLPVRLELASPPALPVSGAAVNLEFLLSSGDDSVRTVSVLPTEIAVVDVSNTIVGQLVPVAFSDGEPDAAILDLSTDRSQPLSTQFRYFQCAGVDPTAQFSFLPMLEVSTNIAEPNYSIIVGTRVLNLP